MREKLSLSVVVPCYNEKNTILEVINALKNVSIDDLEIIVVDDASTDGTTEILKNNRNKIDKLICLKRNGGKGHALKVGFKHATKDIVTIQDADLEYNPKEFVRLLQPFYREDDRAADIVYGSRYARGEVYAVESYWHAMGNRFLTWLFNIKNNVWLTDMETCYKLFRREIIQSINIEEKRFGFEPEISAKVTKTREYNIIEMPISYYPRNYRAGKKIGIIDGIRAIYCILKY